MNKQVKVKIPQSGGRKTIADLEFADRQGNKFYVESKFGKADLTSAQRLAKKNLPNYVVEKWTYKWVEKVGGEIGWGASISVFNQSAEASSPSEASEQIGALPTITVVGSRWLTPEEIEQYVGGEEE